jgi:hypothetical protein
VHLERPLTSSRHQPKPENNLMQELEDVLLEDIYRDLDRINAKIKFPREREIGGLIVHPLEENPEAAQGSGVLAGKTQGFKYDFVDRDLIAYMKDIMLTYTSEEAQVNVDNKLFLVQRIQAKLKDHGVDVEDQDYIGLVLDMIRIVNEIASEETKEATGEGDERDLFLYIIASTFYKVGIEAFTMEENQVSSSVDRELDMPHEKKSVRSCFYLNISS